MILLGVNIDHVATVRQARGTRYPDIVEAALAAERGGADGITVHLREDRRHIQDRDVERLLPAVRTKLNLEMAVTAEMIDIGCRLRPADVCLVPERRQEVTTEGGLDAAGNAAAVGEAVRRLQAVGTRVSLFIDPEPAQIETAKQLGAVAIEIHTGRYADASDAAARAAELERVRAGAALGPLAGTRGQRRTRPDGRERRPDRRHSRHARAQHRPQPRRARAVHRPRGRRARDEAAMVAAAECGA